MYLMFMLIGVGRSTGPSPQSQTATLTFIIPTRVGIYIGNNVTWDFNSISTYPPSAYPAYYTPTTPSSSPYMAVEYLAVVGSTVNWQVLISGSGDPGGGILIGDIEYADAGQNNWTALSTTPTQIASGTGRTTGWVDNSLDWRVNMTGDEEPGTYSNTVTITIQII